MEAFSLGGASRDRVEVRVRAYERAPSGDRYDDNWLTGEVSLTVGGFSGRFAMSMLTQELVAFRGELETLHRTLSGEAKLETMEGQLTLLLTGNGRGQITVRGEGRDDAGSENALAFGLIIDQTHLASTIGELNAVIDAFPVRAV